MFSKLMKKTIAVAAAVAMTSVMAASTSPWWSIDFDSYAEGKLPETEAQGSWTQKADDLSVISGQKLVLDTQGEDLTWTPNAKAENYDSVILDADVKFVASDVEPTTTEDMQTAIYLKALEDGSTELCAYQTIDGAQVWDALEGFKIADGDTKHVNITINYNDESNKPIVTVTIDGISAEPYVAANTTKKVVTSVSFRGTGTIDNFKADTGIDVTYVASVGDKQFEKYAAAFEYVAANGGNLKLTGDSDETLSFGELTFNIDATIDLNGKTIEASFVVDNGAQLKIDNGTVNAPMDYDVVYIKNGKATVGAGAVLNASNNCVVFMKNTADAGAQLALDVYGKLYVTNNTGYAAIQGNGLNKPASTINIFEGAEVAHDFDTAIYHPQNGTLTVGAATITGTTGIEMRAGSLVVDGATITATGKPASTDENNDGTTTVGAAIALSQHSTKLPTSVEVKAGTLTGEYAFLQYNGNETPSTEISATIAATDVELNGAVVVTEEGFAMPKADDGSYTLASGVAIVGNNVYKTLAEAVAAAAAGDTVTLLTDVTTAQTIAIDKDITIDGNGKTLTYTGKDRAITVESSANGADLTVKNLTVDCTASYCQRGINYNTNGKLTLEGVTVKGKNVTYAVNLPGSSDGAEVTITDSDLSGNIALNVWGENAVVNVENTNLTAIDNNSSEGYATVKLNNDGVTAAEGTVINITGGKIDVTGTASDDTEAVSNATSTGEIIISDSTSINGVVATMVAVIRYENGTSYSFTSLEEAIAAAKAGDTVTLLRDVSATEIIAIEKGITLDGNGYTLTSTAARAINIETTAAVEIKNLNIKAGERAINIINEPATVTLTDVTATADNNAVMIATSAGAAKVIIDGCDFTGLAVVNVAGAGAQVTIADTKLTNVDANPNEDYGAITVFTTAEGASVTVTGGEIVVADDSRKAWVFPADATVTGVDDVGYIVATVGDAGYDTIEEALKEAKDGETIVLVRDITASEIITINKDITFDGNGHTLTSTAARAINVDGANGATIENLTIVASGERGINIINGATNVTITDVNVTAKNYAVNLAASAANAVVSIEGSTITGLNAFNAGAANAVVAIADSKIYCNDNSENEYYGAISLNQDAAGTKVVVTDSQFYIKDDSVVAVNGASGKGATITIDGSSEAVISMVAAIDDGNGYSNLFTTLAGAFAEADAGETVKLIANATENVTIAATATLDLNGFAATGTFTITDAAAKFYAAEGLKVASGVDGYEVVPADGYYYLQEKVVEFAPVAVTAIAINGDEAELTIAGEYTEVKVFFCENLGDEWKEVSADFDGSVATVSATTATGFFKVEAR